MFSDTLLYFYSILFSYEKEEKEGISYTEFDWVDVS